MRKVLFTALALGLMTSAAVAEPQTSAVVVEPRQMTEGELERAAAGADLVDVGVVVPVNVVANTAIAAALGVLAEDTQAGAGADVDILEGVGLNQGSLGLGFGND